MASSSERALETRVVMLETEINNLKQEIITLRARIAHPENELRWKKAP
jgi:hypothetical protein